MITDIKQLDLNKLYSYSDYLKWRFKERVELIKGHIFKMSPAPNLSHQRVSARLSGYIFQYLIDKKCEVFSAPFDVRFPKKTKKEVYNVVQPDIAVICDISKLDKRGCLGAPDLIVEILSRSTAKKDIHDKYKLYESNGVKEYWIVHPKDKTLLVYELNKKRKYINTGLYTKGDKVKVGIFEDLRLDLDKIFDTIELD